MAHKEILPDGCDVIGHEGRSAAPQRRARKAGVTHLDQQRARLRPTPVRTRFMLVPLADRSPPARRAGTGPGQWAEKYGICTGRFGISRPPHPSNTNLVASPDDVNRISGDSRIRGEQAARCARGCRPAAGGYQDRVPVGHRVRSAAGRPKYFVRTAAAKICEASGSTRPLRAAGAN
jgi:hypothetical protein